MPVSRDKKNSEIFEEKSITQQGSGKNEDAEDEVTQMGKKADEN